ncbi:MAG: sodium ion-translocating decarboxylase subunit beta, partial [Atribacterota bacterium]
MFGLMESGLQHFYWGNALMIVIALVFIFLGIAKKMEPLLLVPIGFGMLLVNLPLGGLMDYSMDLKAPVSGIVTEVQLIDGSKFREGDIIIQLDSGEVLAPIHGKVDKIKVKPGQRVNTGEIVASAITTAQTDQSKIPTKPEGILARIFRYGIMWHIIPP